MQTPLQNRAENYNTSRQPSAEKELNHTSEDTAKEQSRNLQQFKATPVTVQQKKS